VGLAYQILDDIYDVEGGPDNVGKDTGMDQRNGKATTFPLLYGVTKSRSLMEDYKRKARTTVEGFGQRFAILTELTNFIAPPSDSTSLTWSRRT
jgi:geranylgeranyl pyrophosphate synthase